MADEKQNQQLDAMLDEMLANYSAAQPRPGFQQRLVAVLSEPKSEPRWFQMLGLRWAMASAAAVILIAALYLFWPAPSRGPEQAKKPVKTAQPPAIQEPATASLPGTATADGSTPRQHVAHRRRTVMAKAAAPKLETFPATVPLTDQERLLMSYMARTPRQELIEQSRPDEPLAPELNEGLSAVPQNFNTQRNSR